MYQSHENKDLDNFDTSFPNQVCLECVILFKKLLIIHKLSQNLTNNLHNYKFFHSSITYETVANAQRAIDQLNGKTFINSAGKQNEICVCPFVSFGRR